MKKSLCWSADFETTTDKDDCRVWAYALSNIEDPDKFIYGNSIDGFLEFCQNPKENYTMYFFNLKFDGAFIIAHLLKSGYKHITDSKEKADKTFTTLITDMGAFYQIEIYFKVKGHHTNKVKILDAMKIFPNFSVEKLAEAFGLPISKLELDYKEKREVGHELTQHEIDYIKNDVVIVALALQAMFDKGLTKMTIAGNAMSDFKDRCRSFRKYFPELPEEVDTDIRRSYKGGFTYVNDIYAGVKLGEGMTIDVNSMYPSILRNEPMPVGVPVYFEGKFEPDENYDLYVQTLTCKFELKKGKIPSIQIKHSFSFQSNEYLKSSDNKEVCLTLTNPDLELFFKQYDVTNITWIGGWKFSSCHHIFDNYIDHWMSEKIEAGKEGNKPRKTIAKLLLNSLYGRFGISIKARQKAPILENNELRYVDLPEETRTPLYIPVASFVTSFGRKLIIETSQAIKDYSLAKYGVDKYYYSDTDSCKIGLTDKDLEELKEKGIVKIDDYKLGYFACEEHFTRFMAIRQKCYITEVDGVVHATIAGLPQYLAPMINFDNFKKGFTTSGLSMDDIKQLARDNGHDEETIRKMHRKLRYVYVDGGVILEDTDFTIK